VVAWFLSPTKFWIMTPGGAGAGGLAIRSTFTVAAVQDGIDGLVRLRAAKDREEPKSEEVTGDATSSDVLFQVALGEIAVAVFPRHV